MRNAHIYKILFLFSDFTHHPTSEKLFKLASTSQSPFDLSRVPGVSRSCQIDSEKYLDDLRQFKLWALKGKMLLFKKPIE